MHDASISILWDLCLHKQIRTIRFLPSQISPKIQKCLERAEPASHHPTRSSPSAVSQLEHKMTLPQICLVLRFRRHFLREAKEPKMIETLECHLVPLARNWHPLMKFVMSLRRLPDLNTYGHARKRNLRNLHGRFRPREAVKNANSVTTEQLCSPLNTTPVSGLVFPAEKVRCNTKEDMLFICWDVYLTN